MCDYCDADPRAPALEFGLAGRDACDGNYDRTEMAVLKALLGCNQFQVQIVLASGGSFETYGISDSSDRDHE